VPFRQAGAAAVWERGVDFGVASNDMAHGGRLLELWTPGARYADVYLPLHGPHQGDNAACALAAAEAFFGRPVHADVVAEAVAGTRSPGRMEVLGRRPTVVVDGVKNPEGARAAAATLAEEFAGARSLVLVVGLLQGRDPVEMLEALGARKARLVVACTPATPRALPAAEIVAAAHRLGVDAEDGGAVGPAIERARAAADPDDVILVAGSLYVAGPARAHLAAQ
jgi:dihydrofolate synthase/folylpolyglutamate synthase